MSRQAWVFDVDLTLFAITLAGEALVTCPLLALLPPSDRGSVAETVARESWYGVGNLRRQFDSEFAALNRDLEERGMQRLENGLAGADSRRHGWGVILAGGDGRRLLPLTREIAGDDRPKQFCPVIGSETLLWQTQRRISRLIPHRRTLLVLTSSHAPFYADQIDGIPSTRLVIQPSNQGTSPAIVYSLLRLSEMDPEGIVAFFPSDHFFFDDASFIRHLDSAYTAAVFRPEVVVLLGIAPEAPEIEYGWIEPGITLEDFASPSLFAVKRFWEKPRQRLASALMAQGCLWNTFIMVGSVSAFLNLIRRTLSDLLESFESIRSSLLTVFERTAAAFESMARRATLARPTTSDQPDVSSNTMNRQRCLPNKTAWGFSPNQPSSRS